MGVESLLWTGALCVFLPAVLWFRTTVPDACVPPGPCPSWVIAAGDLADPPGGHNEGALVARPGAGVVWAGDDVRGPGSHGPGTGLQVRGGAGLRVAAGLGAAGHGETVLCDGVIGGTVRRGRRTVAALGVLPHRVGHAPTPCGPA